MTKLNFKYFVIFVVFLYQMQSYIVAYQNWTKFILLNHGIKTSTHVSSITVSSQIECCIQCVRFPPCVSVNYNNYTRTCELNVEKSRFNNPSSFLVQSPGWSVYERQPCGLGWANGSFCHFLVTDQVDWDKAKLSCQMIGLHLTTIYSQDEADAFFADMINAGFDSFVHESFTWLGAKSYGLKGQFHWENTTRNTTNWPNFEVTDLRPDEHCLTADLNNKGKWNTSECKNALPFVCERDSI